MENEGLFEGVLIESEVMNLMDAKKTAVYICSKYRGDIEANTKMARRYCRYALDRGYIPIAPHLLLPQFVDEATERELALSAGIALLDQCCEELWVCGNEISEGMAAELDHADARNMKIRFVTEEDLECTQSAKE